MSSPTPASPSSSNSSQLPSSSSSSSAAAPSSSSSLAPFDARVRDISNSPAYTYLDGLLKQGKLTASQVDYFKTKYQKLHEVVIQTYSNEKILLDKAKELKSALEAERIRLEQRTIMAHDTQADIELLIKQEKEWSMKLQECTDERNAVTYELEEYKASKEEQKANLEERYQKSLSQLDPLVNTLNTKIEELKAEIEKQQELYNKENAAASEYLEKIDAANKAITSLEKEKIKKRTSYQQAQGEPERLRSNIQMIESVAKDLEIESHKLMDEIKLKESNLNALIQERKGTNTEIEDLGVKLENFRLAIAKKKTQLEDLKRMRDIEEQKRAVTLEKTEAIEIAKQEQHEQLRVSMSAINEYHKSIESQKKMYEKLRRKRDTVLSIHKPLLQQIAEAERQHQEMEYQYKQQRAMLNEIKQDEELFISQYLAQEKLEEDTGDLLYGVNADRKEYEEKIKVLDKEERLLQHSINELSSQRELMAREASKATNMYRETKEDLKVKNLILLDLDKQTAETLTRLRTCKSRFEKIKNQRNKLANLTQSSSQALAEMKEKIKILHNEVDILRNESLAKDKALNEEVRLHQSGINTRDALRVEQNKYVNGLKEKKEVENQQIMEMIKLNSIVNNAEHMMMNTRRQYADAVDNRNLTGIQLIDRNDELCILYEKQNIQANIISNGDIELKQKEEEARKHQIEIAEIRRRVEIARKKIPSLQVYAATTRTLAEIEKQLNDERAKTQELCETLESPGTTSSSGGGGGMEEKTGSSSSVNSNGKGSTSSSTTSLIGSNGRCRRLGGNDPEPEQLAAKIEVLEERLNDAKEQLLEKELVLDEVSSLSDKLRMQAAESRGSTLDLAKTVNDVQSRLRKTARKMMATVSELSMYQATAMKLEATKAEAEKKLADARARMEAGLAPTDDAEHEWYRLERDRIRKQEAMLNNQTVRQQAAQAESTTVVTRTTAEPRPNAYIPDDFGIPKPYGQLAPFKPSQAGTSMRHFRNPIIQPVVI